jgi:phosphohistidine phosphatase
MARQLWLLRHAEAEPHGTRTDAERRLTERGRLQARAAGIALQRLQGAFDVVLFSPRVRARQTAELAAEGWSEDQQARLSVHQPLAGGFDAAQALVVMADTSADGRVLMVGHEPDLSGIVGEITGGRADVKKGGVAVLRLEGGAERLEGASGELVLLLRPRELALLADPAIRDVRPPLGGE